MRLGVSFQCPTIWNSDSMTFTLRRVDLGLDRVIYSASLDADNRSPRLVSTRSPLSHNTTSS